MPSPSKRKRHDASEQPSKRRRRICASEHNVESTWNGALAFCNVGLPGDAFEGDTWRKRHERKLRDIFLKLFNMKQKPQGILLCEVGNFSDRIRPRGQRRLEELLTDVFKETGVAKRGFQFFWGSGDTMAAFKPGVQVHDMEPLEKMFRVDDWRTVDRFMLFGATEHGKHALLIYNQHQPSWKG